MVAPVVASWPPPPCPASPATNEVVEAPPHAEQALATSAARTIRAMSVGGKERTEVRGRSRELEAQVGTGEMLASRPASSRPKTLL